MPPACWNKLPSWPCALPPPPMPMQKITRASHLPNAVVLIVASAGWCARPTAVTPGDPPLCVRRLPTAPRVDSTIHPAPIKPEHDRQSHAATARNRLADGGPHHAARGHRRSRMVAGSSADHLLRRHVPVFRL